MGVTIRQLAHLCGVSTATVSLVLGNKDKGRVGVQRREKILRLAEQYGYQSNPAAKGLAEGRTYRVALAIEGVLSDHAIIGQFSFYDRLGLMAKALHGRGYAIEIVQVDTRREAAEVCRDFSRIAADGLVLLNWSPEAAAPILLSLREKRRPAVASGTTLHDDQYTWTDVNRGAAFADATRRLIRDGRRQVLFLDCEVPHLHVAEKQGAFLGVVRDELGRDGKEWMFLSATDSYDGVVALTEEAVRRMPEARAFLLTDNFYAAAVEHALRRAGLHPGADCRVIGFGETALADRCTPRLSHYSLQVEPQVEFSIEALLEEMRDPAAYRPRHRLFGPEFIERET